jgi:uncharacterized protein
MTSIMPSRLMAGPIHDAAKKGDLAKVQALLKGDPSLVRSRDEDGGTPLFWAAANGHKEVVRLLLANKAEINARLSTEARLCSSQ